MDNKKHPKNLVIVRIAATTLILLSLILPPYGLLAHSTAPFVILITLFVFSIVESKHSKKTVSE